MDETPQSKSKIVAIGAFLLLIFAAVVWFVKTNQGTTPGNSPPVSGSPTPSPTPFLPERRIIPVGTAGGKVVSVASGSFKILTLNYINPSSDKPGETQEREIVTNASTKIYLLQETSAKKLKRVATSFADIKAGASVNVQTAGSFTEPGKVTATQVDIFPAGGTPFLPIE